MEEGEHGHVLDLVKLGRILLQNLDVLDSHSLKRGQQNIRTENDHYLIITISHRANIQAALLLSAQTMYVPHTVMARW